MTSAGQLVVALARLIEHGLTAPPLSLVEPAAEAHQTLLVGCRSVDLTCWQDTVCCKGQLVAEDKEVFLACQVLLDAFARGGLVGLNLGAVELDDWVKLGHRLASGEPIDVHGVTTFAAIRPSAVASNRARAEIDGALSCYSALTASLKELQAGQPQSRRRVRRAMQTLVALAQTDSPVLPTLSVLVGSHEQSWGRAVHTAVLGLVMGRQLPLSRAQLLELTAAGLAIGLASEAQPGWAPGAAAEWCRRLTTEGARGAHVAAFEVSWLQHQQECGELYAGQAPASFMAQLLHLAADYLALVSPRAEGCRQDPPKAIMSLTERHDRSLVRLLTRGIGTVPVGTVVELQTGEWAVAAAPATSGSTARPPIKLITDRKGVALETPAVADPATLGLRRVVPPDQARFNVARVLLG